jgi:hypothetical protein
MEDRVTTLRIFESSWTRINKERRPRENLAKTLERILDERDRLENLVKGVNPNVEL